MENQNTSPSVSSSPSSSSSSKKLTIIGFLMVYALIYFWISIRPVEPKHGPLHDEKGVNANPNHHKKIKKEIDDLYLGKEDDDEQLQQQNQSPPPKPKIGSDVVFAPSSTSSSSSSSSTAAQVPRPPPSSPPAPTPPPSPVFDAPPTSSSPKPTTQSTADLRGSNIAKYIEENLMSSKALQNPSSVKKIFKWKAASCQHASWLSSSVLIEKRYATGGFLEEYDELNKMVRKTDANGNPVDPAEHDFYPYVKPPPNKVCVYADRGIWETPFEPSMMDDLRKTPVSVDKIVDRIESFDYDVASTPDPPIIPHTWNHRDKSFKKEPGLDAPILNSKGVDTDAVAPADPGQDLLEKLFAKIGGAVFRGGIPAQQAQMMYLLGISRMPRVPMKVRVCKPGDPTPWCDYAHRPVVRSPPPDPQNYPEETTQQIVRLNFRGNSFGRAFTSAFAAIFRGRERYFDRGVHTFVRYQVTNYGDYYYFSPRFFNGDIAYAPFVRVERPDEVVFFEICFEFTDGYHLSPTDSAKTPRSTLFSAFQPSFAGMDPIVRSGGEFSGTLMRPFRLYYYAPRVMCPSDEMRRIHAQWFLTKQFDCSIFRRKDPNASTAPPCFGGIIQTPVRQRIECAQLQEAQLKLTLLQLENFQSTLPSPASALQDDDTPNWIRNDFNQRNAPLPRSQQQQSTARKRLKRRNLIWLPQPRGLEMESFSFADDHWHTQMIVGGHYPETAAWIRGGGDFPPYDGVSKPETEIIWQKVDAVKKKYLETGISPDPKRLNVTKPGFDLTKELYNLERSKYRATWMGGDRPSRKMLFKYFFGAFMSFEGER